MRKFFTVMKREYAQVVKKKSFIVMVFLTPVLMTGMMILPAIFAGKGVTETERLAIIDQSGTGVGRQFAQSLSEYTIDETLAAYQVSGLYEIPAAEIERFSRHYDSLTSLIADQRLKYVLVIGESAHLADSNLHIVTNSDNFRSLRRFETELTDILSSQRLTQSNINLPVDSVLALTQRLDLTIKDTQGESTPFIIKYFASIIFVMLMYMMIMTNGATLMRSVIEEKSSRIMEVLISSVTPFQLMLGKVIGLGLAAFTQVAVWVSIGLGIFVAGNLAMVQIEPSIGRILFNPVIVTFFILFFVVGYIMYSTLFAMIGSIVNSDKEAQHFIIPITLSLMIPVIVGMAVIQDPYATWVTVMTYIPLLTPTMMIMRVVFLAPAATSFSLFSGILAEATLGLLVVIAFALVLIWVTSRIFRVGILMYGKRPTLPELVKWIRY